MSKKGRSRKNKWGKVCGVYIQIGENHFVRTKEIIAIIHWNSSDDSVKLESPLQIPPLEKGKDVPWRSLVITENGTYVSPFSPKTLEKRIQNAKFFLEYSQIFLFQSWF